MKKEREQKQWWAVTEFGVREVTGYSCKPNNPEMWWCPEAGFSGSEGHHLFPTEEQALDKAIVESLKDLEGAQKFHDRLLARRAELRNG